MSPHMLRRALICLALLAGLSGTIAFAQTPAQTVPPLKSFASAEAAAAAMVDAIRHDDISAMAAMFGDDWRRLVPAADEDRESLRARFLAGWDENHKVVISDDVKATVQVGTTGWTMPVPIMKQADGWRFDIVAGEREIAARRIGRNELAVIQTMLAIVDAQRDYAALDPMKVGMAVYARQLLSTPGQKDGLYWETAPGEPQSPLGPALAKAQADKQRRGDLGDGYYGYQFRILYSQGPANRRGARDYVVHGKLVGGFGVIASPIAYGETGVMTFIVNQRGQVYEQDLGPDTASRAEAITTYNPDSDWTQADMTPP